MGDRGAGEEQRVNDVSSGQQQYDVKCVQWSAACVGTWGALGRGGSAATSAASERLSVWVGLWLPALL